MAEVNKIQLMYIMLNNIYLNLFLDRLSYTLIYSNIHYIFVPLTVYTSLHYITLTLH